MHGESDAGNHHVWLPCLHVVNRCSMRLAWSSALAGRRFSERRAGSGGTGYAAEAWTPTTHVARMIACRCCCCLDFISTMLVVMILASLVAVRMNGSRLAPDAHSAHRRSTASDWFDTGPDVNRSRGCG